MKNTISEHPSTYFHIVSTNWTGILKSKEIGRNTINSYLCFIHRVNR